MALRLAFMGSSPFSLASLNALVKSNHELVAIYSQPPRPAGRRGLQLKPSIIHERALELNIPIYNPVNFKNDKDQEIFKNLALDAAIVVAYGLLLPKAILQAPKFGCYNLHASLLPRWRGAAPIQRAIMAGDSTTGAMIMKMDEGLDTGPILRSCQVPITMDSDFASLSAILAQKGADLLLESLDQLEYEGKDLKLTAQSAEGVCYAAKIRKEEARLDLTDSAFNLHKKICALAPSPGAYCEFLINNNWQRVKLLKTRFIAKDQLAKDAYVKSCGHSNCKLAFALPAGFADMADGQYNGQNNRPAPKAKGLFFLCPDGALEVLLLQRAGGKLVTSREFLAGARIEAIG